MEEDVGGCEGEVGQHADGDVPLAVARLRRRPEQRVDRVLPEGREQSVADLEANRGGTDHSLLTTVETAYKVTSYKVKSLKK